MLFYLVNLLKSPINKRSPLRPPGAVREEEFVQRCIKCHKCAQICPYNSIKIAHMSWGDKYGTPMIFPRQVPCYVCMKCPPECPTGALDNEVIQKENVKMGLARIDSSKCLPYNGIICRACFERCPIYREAITLKNELYPEVNPDKCIGCGICENVCPAEEVAITVTSAHAVIE